MRLHRLDLLAALFTATALAGCSTTTVYEWDSSGALIRKTETSTDIVGTLAHSAQDKTLLVWRSGWAGYLSVSPGTFEDPSPHGKVFVGKTDGGYMSVHKDHQRLDFHGMAEVVRAAGGDLSITADAARLKVAAEEAENGGTR